MPVRQRPGRRWTGGGTGGPWRGRRGPRDRPGGGPPPRRPHPTARPPGRCRLPGPAVSPGHWSRSRRPPPGSVPLLADDVGDRTARTRALPPRRDRPLCPIGPPYDTFGGQALDRGGRFEPEQPGDGEATVSNDDLGPFTDSFQPVAQVRPQVSDRNIHTIKCTTRTLATWTASADALILRRGCMATGRSGPHR